MFTGVRVIVSVLECDSVYVGVCRCVCAGVCK
jgi:hypothetical protein